MRTAVENIETFGEKFAEVMQSVQMIGQSVFTALGNASSLYFEQQNAQIDRTYEKEMLMAQQESDRKLLALEEDHAFSKIKEERRIQMLQNMTAAERQAFKIEQDYNKQREKLEQELADQEVAIQEEAAAEKRKIARKEAQVQKKLALLSATVNTAAAIVSALASVPPNVPLSIAVGIAGAAQIGTILATPLPALSDGGIAYGNTIAQVGEYSGASVNPEVIAPLDKLQSMMGGGTVKVVGEISGENIVLASERYNKRANRSF
jgi:beta-glucosidase-like glycosyl hydrolase